MTFKDLQKIVQSRSSPAQEELLEIKRQTILDLGPETAQTGRH
ncbi:MAG TPA: hypothetical protein VKA91_12270 [Nitrososphaeraceae archaeon]|nr:hypothetical protein [Nitrososphaeraceae archaeon]